MCFYTYALLNGIANLLTLTLFMAHGQVLNTCTAFKFSCAITISYHVNVRTRHRASWMTGLGVIVVRQWCCNAVLPYYYQNKYQIRVIIC